MSLLSITEAAHVAGVSRRTIQRSIQSGRLSTATTTTGERAIDTTELLRVFGPLRHAPSDTPASMSQHVATNDAPNDAPNDTMTMLVEVLRDQLQQAQQEKAHLLAMLEAEQQARRDLETKLLPAPKPTLVGKVRMWILLAMLAAALVFAGWHFRAVIVSALAS